MKKLAIKILAVIAFSSCKAPNSDNGCNVTSVTRSDYYKYKYEVRVSCEIGLLYLETDTLYSVGDTIQFSKKK